MNRLRYLPPILVLPLILLVTGCVAVTQDAAFQSVQGDVAGLSGQRVVWNQGTADDQKADAAVHALLNKPLQVNDAVQVALLHNPDLQASFEEIGISQADLVQAGLLKNPGIAGSWRFPDRPPGFSDVEYSFTEDFLGLILIPLKTKVAKTNLEETELRVAQQVIHLVAEVKTAFYTIQADQQLGDRLKLIIQADQAGADLAAAQFKSGNINEADYATQQAQFATSHLYLATAQKEMIMDREKLNRLMGTWGTETDWSLAPALPPVPEEEISLKHLESLAISQRRDLAAMKKSVDSLGATLALRTNTRFLPTSIYAGADTEKSPDGQRVSGPTLDLTLPIFDQGQGEIPKLAAEYRQAQRELQSKAIQIRSEVREARDTLILNRDMVQYYKKIVVPLNIQVVNQSLLQYNAMQKNTFDLLLTKQRELESEKNYITSWRDYWISRAQLEEAVGGSMVLIPKHTP